MFKYKIAATARWIIVALWSKVLFAKKQPMVKFLAAQCRKLRRVQLPFLFFSNTLRTLRSKFEFSFVAPINFRQKKLGEVDKMTSKIILCDHVRNSHDHSVLQFTDITRRNLMLITLKAQRVNVVIFTLIMELRKKINEMQWNENCFVCWLDMPPI